MKVTWTEFASDAKRCHTCGLHRTSGVFNLAGETVFDTPALIATHVRIALVGEAPGENEEEQERNFVGRAGQVLDECLDAAKLSREDVWICNAVRCRPTNAAGKNRKPIVREVDACRGYLVAELQRVQPNVIVALGDTALTSLIGKTLGGVTQQKLRVVWSDEFNAWVIATVHPAFALRRYAERHWIVEALKLAKHVLEHGGPVRGPETDIETITDIDQAREAQAAILNADRLHYDWETNGLHLTRSLGFCVSVAIRERRAYVFPRFGQNWSVIWSKAELRALDDILKEIFLSSVPKGGFNIAFDNCITRSTLGIWPNAIAFDAMHAHHLLNNHLGSGAHALKTCASLYTDLGRYDDELDEWLIRNEWTDQGRPDHGQIWRAPDELVHKYNGKDSDASFRLENIFTPLLHDENLWEVFTNERMPLVVEHQEIDRRGLRLNVPHLNKISGQLGDSLDQIDMRISEIAGRPVNPASHKQIAALLYDQLGLPILARTETGQPSTKEEVLKQLEDENEIVAMVLRRRAYEKIKGTYVDGTGAAARTEKKALRAVLDADGCARMNTLLHGTVTHRFVTKKPFSPHTFPKTVPGMPSVRALIIPDDGYRFVLSDYVQQEAVLQAILANQTDMVESILDKGEDIHEMVTRELGGMAKSEYQDSDGAWLSKEHEQIYRAARTKWKACSFMILYRGGAAKLARNALGCTVTKENSKCKHADETTGLCSCVTTAETYIRDYYEKFERIKWWQYDTIKFTRQHGYVTEPFGTRRHLPGINDRDKRVQAEAEREACNYPIQRGGAAVMIRALLRTQARFRGKPPLRAAFPGWAMVKRVRKIHEIPPLDLIPPRRQPVFASDDAWEPYSPHVSANPYQTIDQDSDWQFPGRVVVTVHDQLISQVRHDLTEEGLYIQRAEMERPYPELGGRSLRTDNVIADCWE